MIFVLEIAIFQGLEATFDKIVFRHDFVKIMVSETVQLKVQSGFSSLRVRKPCSSRDVLGYFGKMYTGAAGKWPWQETPPPPPRGVG